MDFLFHARDKAGVDAELDSLTEAHWSFMDQYRLLVRGPTLSDDGEEHTGSLHIVQLDSRAETETFAYQEPYFKGGCYASVDIRRWQDRLHRPIHDFKPNGDDPLFLVLGQARAGALPPDLPAEHRDRIAAYGWSGTLDGDTWTGFAMVQQAPSRAAVFVPESASSEIHRWCIGGRR
jgi:uncharacterized protein YciI